MASSIHKSEVLCRLATDLKERATQAQRQFENWKTDCKQQLARINREITKLETEKSVVSFNYKQELDQREREAKQQQEIYNNFTNAIKVGRIY
jgi:hypothetical protein